MNTILITGIGGSIGIDIARSLRHDRSLRLVGGDGSPWGLRQGARLCDQVVSLPHAGADPRAYFQALTDAIKQFEADFVFINPDPELEAVAAADWRPPCPHPLPPPDVMAACLDKGATVARAQTDDDFPATVVLEHRCAVATPFAKLQSPLWLRATVGPGGLGSILVETADEAEAWIRYWEKRGEVEQWMFQEYLPGRNYNWTGLYVAGELVAAAAMERIRYFLAGAAVSGVSGQVAECATVDPQPLGPPADRVIRAIDTRPHGLYSADLREDSDGRPRVTEINPRLAGRPWLYTNAGVNFPLAAYRALAGNALSTALQPTSLRIGLHLVRQLDVEPLLGACPVTSDPAAVACTASSGGDANLHLAVPPPVGH